MGDTQPVRGESLIFHRNQQFATHRLPGWSCSGVKAFANFREHTLIDPRAMTIRASHPGQSRRARGERGLGGELGAAVGAIDPFAMFVMQLFDDVENLFAQRDRMNRSRIFKARA